MPFCFVCARHGAQRRDWRCQPIAKASREVTWRCKSSGDLDDRNPELNGNCDAVTRRGKEAAGKAPARGVRTADEAQRWWARGHKDSKPDVIRTGAAYMRRVDGVTVTRLTLGDLLACL
jgi:hypothetical protein